MKTQKPRAIEYIKTNGNAATPCWRHHPAQASMACCVSSVLSSVPESQQGCLESHTRTHTRARAKATPFAEQSLKYVHSMWLHAYLAAALSPQKMGDFPTPPRGSGGPPSFLTF